MERESRKEREKREKSCLCASTNFSLLLVRTFLLVPCPTPSVSGAKNSFHSHLFLPFFPSVLPEYSINITSNILYSISLSPSHPNGDSLKSKEEKREKE